MVKSYVLEKLAEYNGKTVILGLADQAVVLEVGMDGHWLFVDDVKNSLIEVKVNTASQGLYAATPNQQEMPYVITTIQFDTVNFIRTYIGDTPGSIAAALEGATPVATTKTKQELINEMESHSIRRAISPTGNLNDPHVAPGGSYGSFKGSMISTEKDGLPKYVKDKLLS